jgi:hypothetical protein
VSDDVAVVWLAPDEGDAARALAEWGRARGVRLVAVEDAASASGLRVDVTIGERVEKEIERAREAIAALDADGAERALARADAVLRDHPELPQAAWLRAEVERSWAARFTRVDPRDDARAGEHWKNAHALDGGRVAGVGESDLGPKKRVPASFVVGGTRGRPVVVRLDGIDLGAGATSEGGRITFTVEAAVAEHQLVAYSDGEPVFASWVTIAAGAPPIEIELATGGICARSAFASVSREDLQVRAPGVTCPRWVAAVPTDRAGSVLVSRCERDACGPLLEWRVERWGDSGPPQPFGRRTVWPGWATWTIVGVGAATATAITLVATGVFESRPVEQRFVSGGARVE